MSCIALRLPSQNEGDGGPRRRRRGEMCCRMMRVMRPEAAKPKRSKGARRRRSVLRVSRPLSMMRAGLQRTCTQAFRSGTLAVSGNGRGSKEDVVEDQLDHWQVKIGDEATNTTTRVLTDRRRRANESQRANTSPRNHRSFPFWCGPPALCPLCRRDRAVSCALPITGMTCIPYYTRNRTASTPKAHHVRPSFANVSPTSAPAPRVARALSAC